MKAMLQFMVVDGPAMGGGHPAAVAPAEEGNKNEQQPAKAKDGVKGVEEKRPPRQAVERHGEEGKKVGDGCKKQPQVGMVAA